MNAILHTDWASVLTLLVMVGLWFYGVKHWNGPAQDARFQAQQRQIDAQQRQIDALKGNHDRFERDTAEWQRGQSESTDAILKEVRSISEVNRDRSNLRDEVIAISNRVADVEQAIQTCKDLGRMEV